MRWAGYVARLYIKFWLEILKGRNLLEEVRLEDNVKRILKKRGGKLWTALHWHGTRS
jgi:hypothetical protein